MDCGFCKILLTAQKRVTFSSNYLVTNANKLSKLLGTILKIP